MRVWSVDRRVGCDARIEGVSFAAMAADRASAKRQDDLLLFSGDEMARIFVSSLIVSFPEAKPKGKLTIYSGNTLHRKDAKVYELRAGDATDGIEIVLPLNGLHSVRGIAASKDGIPLNAGSLHPCITGDSAINFHTRIDADGTFVFSGIPEDTYQLKASNAFIFFENAPSAEVPPEQLFPIQSATVQAVARICRDDYAGGGPDHRYRGPYSDASRQEALRCAEAIHPSGSGPGR